MNNVHIDDNQKQNVRGKMVTTIDKLLKVLVIRQRETTVFIKTPLVYCSSL